MNTAEDIFQVKSCIKILGNIKIDTTISIFYS